MNGVLVHGFRFYYLSNTANDAIETISILITMLRFIFVPTCKLLKTIPRR